MKATLNDRDFLLSEIMICALPFLYYITIFNCLPLEIPIHFNANGIADRLVPKLSVEVAVICTLGYLGLLIGLAIKKLIVTIQKSQENSNTETAAKMMTYNQAGLAIFFTAMGM